MKVLQEVNTMALLGMKNLVNKNNEWQISIEIDFYTYVILEFIIWVV